MYNKIYNLIKQYDKIIIHRHEKPDGDALGSQMGFKIALLETFPHKKVFVVGDMTEYLNYMGKMDEIEDDEYKDALVIVLDTGAEYLISDKRYIYGKEIIKIDHHIPQGTYGNYALVNTKYESCCSLITHFIKVNKMKLNQQGANYLFTGMVTDSGRFRYSSVSSKTFDAASYLMKYKVQLDDIYTKLYTDKLENVLLKARMTLKFEILDCGVAYIKNTYQDVLETNMTPYALARGIVNNMAGIKEICLWATFTELEDGKVIVELRSSGKNVNQIVVKYGGGGHLQASGATVASFEEADLVINDLIALAKE